MSPTTLNILFTILCDEVENCSQFHFFHFRDYTSGILLDFTNWKAY